MRFDSIFVQSRQLSPCLGHSTGARMAGDFFFTPQNAGTGARKKLKNRISPFRGSTAVFYKKAQKIPSQPESLKNLREACDTQIKCHTAPTNPLDLFHIIQYCNLVMKKKGFREFTSVGKAN